MVRPRTPIAAGDPIWVSVNGQEQAKAGILVRWGSEDHPMTGNAVVQLIDQAAGSHQIYPAGQLHYRRDGSHPSDIKPHRARESPPRTGPPALAPAVSPSDPYDQLIDAMGRVADKIESLIKDNASEVAVAHRRLKNIRKKRGAQLRRIRAAVRLLRGEWHRARESPPRTGPPALA